jgi:hypothetical protein
MEMHGTPKQLVQGLNDKTNNSSTGLVKKTTTTQHVFQSVDAILEFSVSNSSLS